MLPLQEGLVDRRDIKRRVVGGLDQLPNVFALELKSRSS
jgi:hypothetical protein